MRVCVLSVRVLSVCLCLVFMISCIRVSVCSGQHNRSGDRKDQMPGFKVWTHGSREWQLMFWSDSIFYLFATSVGIRKEQSEQVPEVQKCDRQGTIEAGHNGAQPLQAICRGV